MKPNYVRQIVCPILAALIWGTAFVAQRICSEYLPIFAFNAIRSALAVLFLYPLSRILDASGARRGVPPAKTDRRALLFGGFWCGLVIAAANNLQQAGVAGTAAGKAGFITASYVVLVPVFGIFIRRRTTLQVWAGVALEAVGLYLLCIRAGEGFSIQPTDVYLILCACVYAVQIYVIEYYSARVDGVKLACAQFVAAGIISAVMSLCLETVVWANVGKCLLPLLYMSIFASGIAYVLQIVAQKGSNPTIVSLLFSLESVFAAVAGAVILGDRLTGREDWGCLLMLAAVVLAQIPTFRHSPS